MKKAKILKGFETNFETLIKAVKNNDVALVSLKEITTGEYRVVLCAMQRNDDKTITPVPLAQLFESNPYEIFEPPM